MNYIPLHIHSEYTFLESCLKIDDLALISKDGSFDYIGICDEENAFAFPKFSHVMKGSSSKPVFGCTLFLKTKSGRCPLCLYVKNETGYRNLCKLISLKKNLTIRELNSTNGLILVLPCRSYDYIFSLFKDNNPNKERIIFEIQKNFEDFYLGIEIYSNDDITIMNNVREFASSHSYKTIAFPLHLYGNKNEARTLEILKAIKNETKLDKNFTLTGPYHFLSEGSVNKVYTQEEISATHQLAQSTDFEFLIKRGSLLKYPLDNISDKKKYIHDRCFENAKLKNISIDKIHSERLDYELNTIEKMGYLDYFLIVSDYVNYAKNASIPVGPGRGSAAGALVSYYLGITDVDPLKYDLLFERFLNPERVTMPDIDVDIADTKRNDVINYIDKRYGPFKMANIIAFQTIGAKQAIRDIGRVFSFNQMDINTLSKACRGKDETLSQTRKEFAEFDKLCSDNYYAQIYSLAELIEGFPRQTGMHAAGIILNDTPLNEIIPLDTLEDGRLISEFEAVYLEEEGFLKMDILGLRNLSIIDNIVSRLKARNINIDLLNLPLDDEKTFNTLTEGYTQGVFQLESPGMVRSIKEVKISSFDDIVAMIALYRPGPMEFIKVYADNKNNHKEIKYIHPLLEEILKPTYGVIIYQEQIMQIVQKIASFSLAQADLFRRAISKKDESKLNSLKSSFMEGSKKNGIDEKTADAIFQMIYKFADYGFNKSHSVVYALICYQMAYLKTHYPSDFFASLLDFQSLSDSKYSKYMNEFSYFNIQLTLPDINVSGEEYQVNENKIIIPFQAIKGLPMDISKAIVHERNESGKFKDFTDFVTRMHAYHLTAKQIILLVDAGVFDSFQKTRTSLRKTASTIIEYINSLEAKVDGFTYTKEDLYSLAPSIEDFPEDDNTKYQKEIEVLGILISGSLFTKYTDDMKTKNALTINEAFNYEGKIISLAAIITEIKVIQTKKKEDMAILTTYDDSAILEMVVFPKTYEEEKIRIEKNIPLLFEGYVKEDEVRGKSFIVNSIKKLEENKK